MGDAAAAAYSSSFLASRSDVSTPSASPEAGGNGGVIDDALKQPASIAIDGEPPLSSPLLSSSLMGVEGGAQGEGEGGEGENEEYLKYADSVLKSLGDGFGGEEEEEGGGGGRAEQTALAGAEGAAPQNFSNSDAPPPPSPPRNPQAQPPAPPSSSGLD